MMMYLRVMEGKEQQQPKFQHITSHWWLTVMTGRMKLILSQSLYPVSSLLKLSPQMCFGCGALHLVWIFSEIRTAFTVFSLTPPLLKHYPLIFLILMTVCLHFHTKFTHWCFFSPKPAKCHCLSAFIGQEKFLLSLLFISLKILCSFFQLFSGVVLKQ